MKGIIVQKSINLLLIAAALSAAAITGCGWPQKSQVSRLQDEKSQLVERVGYEVRQKQQLQAQNSELLTRVGQAERELAQFVARGAAANPATATQPNAVAAGTAPITPIGQPPAPAAPAASAKVVAGLLKSLEARYADVQFDAGKGAYRYGSPLTFKRAEVELHDAGKAKLDQLAALLTATSAAGKVHLLIAASADAGETKAAGPAASGGLDISAKRAAQVASYLRLRGVPESTISALSYTAESPGAAGVQVFLTPPGSAATALHQSVKPAATR